MKGWEMKNKGLFALVALLSIALVGATVGAAASASDGGAMAAKKKKKKKCPAGTHKVVKVKKKNGKKIKKIKCVPNTTNNGNNGSSLVRASVTWAPGPNGEDPSADDADIDLFVFDASGHQAGNGQDTIPNSTMSPDITGKQGTETFTDTAPQPLRKFSFGICYTVGGSVHTAYTITFVTSDGVTHTQTRADNNSATGGFDSLGGSARVDYVRDGVPITTDYCGPGHGSPLQG